MNFKEYLNRSLVESREDVKVAVHAAWDKYFKNAFASNGKTALSVDNYSTFRFYFGSTKSEFANGIEQNDPLSLMLSVDGDIAGGYVVEFSSKSILVNPENDYLAYSTHKFKLRKIRAKNLKELQNKLEKAFKTVNEDTKKLLTAGELGVHGDKITTMINKKLK